MHSFNVARLTLAAAAPARFTLTEPGLTAGLAHFWLKERIALPQLVGMAVTFVALAAYVLQPPPNLA